MSPKVWGQLLDGQIKIITLEKERIKEAAETLRINFFPYESVCLGCDLVSNTAACDEVALLASRIAEDGVSLIAVENETGKIVGVSFNKLQTVSDEPSFLEKFRDEQCNQANSISLINFDINLDSTYNVFESYNVDCAMEIIFLGVNPDCSGKGVGKALVECSISLSNSLKGCKKVPKVVCSLFTSVYSHKIGVDLNFTEVFRETFDKFSYEGKWKFSDRVDLRVQNVVVMMVKSLK